MRSCFRCSLALLMLALAGTAQAVPILIASLAGDYKAGNTWGDTSDSVGVAGTLSGSWHYYQDNDHNPASNQGLLSWQHQGNLGGSGNEYGGTQGFYLWSDFPMLANEVLFEPYSMPADHIMGHGGPTEYLAVQYLADTSYDNVSIDYRLEKPNTGGSLAPVYIEKGDGTVLFSATLGNSVENVSGTINLGTLSAGDSIWLFEVDGWAGGGQTFLKLDIGTVPEPSTWLLTAPLLALLAGLRRRR